jgi:hypothetical protein
MASASRFLLLFVVYLHLEFQAVAALTGGSTYLQWKKASGITGFVDVPLPFVQNLAQRSQGSSSPAPTAADLNTVGVDVIAYNNTHLMAMLSQPVISDSRSVFLWEVLGIAAPTLAGYFDVEFLGVLGVTANGVVLGLSRERRGFAPQLILTGYAFENGSTLWHMNIGWADYKGAFNDCIGAGVSQLPPSRINFTTTSTKTVLVSSNATNTTNGTKAMTNATATSRNSTAANVSNTTGSVPVNVTTSSSGSAVMFSFYCVGDSNSIFAAATGVSRSEAFLVSVLNLGRESSVSSVTISPAGQLFVYSQLSTGRFPLSRIDVLSMFALQSYPKPGVTLNRTSDGIVTSIRRISNLSAADSSTSFIGANDYAYFLPFQGSLMASDYYLALLRRLPSNASRDVMIFNITGSRVGLPALWSRSYPEYSKATASRSIALTLDSNGIAVTFVDTGLGSYAKLNAFSLQDGSALWSSDASFNLAGYQLLQLKCARNGVLVNFEGALGYGWSQYATAYINGLSGYTAWNVSSLAPLSAMYLPIRASFSLLHPNRILLATVDGQLFALSGCGDADCGSPQLVLKTTSWLAPGLGLSIGIAFLLCYGIYLERRYPVSKMVDPHKHPHLHTAKGVAHADAPPKPAAFPFANSILNGAAPSPPQGADPPTQKQQSEIHPAVEMEGTVNADIDAPLPSTPSNRAPSG